MLFYQYENVNDVDTKVVMKLRAAVCFQVLFALRSCGQLMRRKFECRGTIVSRQCLYRTGRRTEHGRNKSFDEVQFSNFRAEMSSKTISFHQPSQPSLSLSLWLFLSPHPFAIPV